MADLEASDRSASDEAIGQALADVGETELVDAALSRATAAFYLAVGSDPRAARALIQQFADESALTRHEVEKKFGPDRGEGDVGEK